MLPTSVIILLVLCLISMAVFMTSMVAKENHLEELWKKSDDKSSESYTWRCTNSKKLLFLERMEMFSGIFFIAVAILLIISFCKMCKLLGV